MGYSVDLEADDLRCRSEEGARKAAAIVTGHEWMSPYHFQVSVWQPPDPRHDWALNIEHVQGDHWHDYEAREVWLAPAPFMTDGRNSLQARRNRTATVKSESRGGRGTGWSTPRARRRRRRDASLGLAPWPGTRFRNRWGL
jgi:hypothetical protein